MYSTKVGKKSKGYDNEAKKPKRLKPKALKLCRADDEGRKRVMNGEVGAEY
jgi:hypothetical protein